MNAHGEEPAFQNWNVFWKPYCKEYTEQYYVCIEMNESVRWPSFQVHYRVSLHLVCIEKSAAKWSLYG